MVHRFLAPRVGSAAALASMMLTSAAASAFCRTTTCNLRVPPPDCMLMPDADPEDKCYATGAPLFWEQGCVSYAVQWNGSVLRGLTYGDLEPIVAAAFAAWPTASCEDAFPSIAVQSLGPSYCAPKEFNPEGPNSNSVLFVDEDWVADTSALALTTVSFDVHTGKILDADIEVNTQSWTFSRELLEQTLTHEAGHFYGLGHSSAPNAVMNREVEFGATPFTGSLTDDDMQGICAAYPATRPIPALCKFEPERGFSPDCGGDVEASCAFTAAPRRASEWTLFAGVGWAALLVLRRRRAQGRNS